MTNHKFTKKQFAALGLRKSEAGDYIFINPNEANQSKYNPVDKRKANQKDGIKVPSNKES
jgi:hypothetical protein